MGSFDKPSRQIERSRESAAVRLADINLLSVQQEYGKANRDIASTAVSGLSSRLCYLAVSGKLNVDLDAQEQLLGSKAGPVGKALFKRMSNMRSEGWEFRQVDSLDNVAHNAGLRTVTHLSPESALVPYAVGVGVEHPAVSSAILLAHELGHHDGVPRWAVPTPGAEQDIMVLRNIASEGRAMMTEAHIGQLLGSKASRIQAIAKAIQTEDLGGYIFDVHHYLGFESVGRSCASKSYRKYSNETLGRDLVDKDGRIRAFDIDKGVGVRIGELEDDAFFASGKNELLSKMRASVFRGIAGREFAARFTETAQGKSLLRSGKVLGALGILATTTDISGAFGRSTGAGFGRLAEVGTQWAGYECGAFLINSVLRSGPLSLRVAAVLGAGMVGTMAVDHVLGRKVESSIQQMVDGAIGGMRR